MAVCYKFKSAKDYDSISIHGHFITLADLKEQIFKNKHLVLILICFLPMLRLMKVCLNLSNLYK